MVAQLDELTGKEPTVQTPPTSEERASGKNESKDITREEAEDMYLYPEKYNNDITMYYHWEYTNEDGTPCRVRFAYSYTDVYGTPVMLCTLTFNLA